MIKRISTWILTAAIGLAVVTLTGNALAQDKKVDPTGKWTWSFTAGNGNTMTQTLNLKLEGDKLTGKMLGRNGTETAIEEAKLKGNEISFQVTRERNGNKMVSKYTGKIDGDKIKGSIAFTRNGQDQKRDWEAKREAKKD